MFFFVSDEAIRTGAEVAKEFRRHSALFDGTVFLGGA
jgi:hypothetical protein